MPGSILPYARVDFVPPSQTKMSFSGVGDKEYLWGGIHKSTGLPFSVQYIVEALKGKN